MLSASKFFRINKRNGSMFQKPGVCHLHTVWLLVRGSFIYITSYRALSSRRRYPTTATPTPPRMEKMARLGFCAVSSLIDLDLGWGFAISFYSVQDCSRDYFEVHGLWGEKICVYQWSVRTDSKQKQDDNRLRVYWRVTSDRKHWTH